MGIHALHGTPAILAAACDKDVAGATVYSATESCKKLRPYIRRSERDMILPPEIQKTLLNISFGIAQCAGEMDAFPEGK